jgi:hypothetical protein
MTYQLEKLLSVERNMKTELLLLMWGMVRDVEGWKDDVT